MKPPFDLVLADPAWPFRDRLRHSKTRRGAEDNYPTLTVEQIARLPVAEAVAKDALLLLWVTGGHLFEAPYVFRSWGFSYAGQFAAWGKVQKHDRTKPKIGMGRLFRQSQEIALVCTRGRVHRHLELRNVSSLFLEPITKHSAKPEAPQDALERMFPSFTRRLELFARRERRGWTCVGNEIDGRDIRESVAELAKARAA